MPRCTAEPAHWKGRSAFRLGNGTIEITMLFGGGHIADLRLCGSPINVLFEAPWRTIEPQTFSPGEHAALYGEGPVGKLLSGYTGHAVALGYFGMPGNQALPLHGEAVATEWQIEDSTADSESASVTFIVELPVSQLHFARKITLSAGSHAASIDETLHNLSAESQDVQWVEHAAFGEPLLAPNESVLHLSAVHGITSPLGYEGRALLPDNREFTWPHIAATDGAEIDLANPFAREGAGFVAALLADKSRDHAFIAVHNRRLRLLAGYVYRAHDFPWIALWEENCARPYAPWNGITRVRGVEFGNTPMPLGLDHARAHSTLFDAPTYEVLAPRASVSKSYFAFVCSGTEELTTIQDVDISGTELVIHAGDRTIHC